MIRETDDVLLRMQDLGQDRSIFGAYSHVSPLNDGNNEIRSEAYYPYHSGHRTASQQRFVSHSLTELCGDRSLANYSCGCMSWLGGIRWLRDP